MLYACNHCKYLFESNNEVNQCPDCGKYAVRPATKTEIEEYESRDKNWDDGGDLFGRKTILDHDRVHCGSS